MKVTLYYKKGCPYCQRVLDHLRKLEKTLQKKDIEEDSHIKNELLSIGGKVQVPCLVIDKKALYESDAIISFLSKNINNLP